MMNTNDYCRLRGKILLIGIDVEVGIDTSVDCAVRECQAVRKDMVGVIREY